MYCCNILNDLGYPGLEELFPAVRQKLPNQGLSDIRLFQAAQQDEQYMHTVYDILCRVSF